MADSDDIYREVMIIKKDVEAVKHQTSWILRSHAESVAGHWQDVFGLTPGKRRHYSKMRVYLAVNGKRTVNEIATVAEVHRQDAGQWLKEMETHELVELLPVSKTIKTYQKTPADFALGISRSLEEELAKKNDADGEKL